MTRLPKAAIGDCLIADFFCQQKPTFHNMPMNQVATFLLVCLICTAPAAGQVRTVGIFQHDDGGFGGYTLVAPLTYPSTYLINEYGEMVNRWDHDFLVGTTVHLLKNGNLLRASAAPDSWVAQGGQGGRLEEIAWDGTVLWQYELVSPKIMLHHDVVAMPNGNVLATAWERMNVAELAAVGFDTTALTADTVLWSERIVELKPLPPDSAEIVWEWHAFDHLVQNHDPAKPNYGEIKDYPWRINVNTGIGGSWLHFNGMDYNADLNLIMVSAGYFSEVWVINRRSTTEEARGAKGDLLYRFGNPQMYAAGDSADRRFYFNHSPHWLGNGLPGEGNVMVFDNGRMRPPPAYSTVQELALPYNVDYDGNVFFNLGMDGAYEPPIEVWHYSDPGNLFSLVTSGMQRLPNGNTVILEGMTGRILEIDSNENKVWEYVNPVIRGGPLARDEPIPTFVPNDPNPTPILQNLLFRVYRYARDYPGLRGKDLSPKGVIELPPTATESTTSIPDGIALHQNYPNPFNPTTTLSFTLDSAGLVRLAVYDLLGRELSVLVDGYREAGRHEMYFDATGLASGVYLYRLDTDGASRQQRMLLVR